MTDEQPKPCPNPKCHRNGPSLQVKPNFVYKYHCRCGISVEAKGEGNALDIWNSIPRNTGPTLEEIEALTPYELPNRDLAYPTQGCIPVERIRALFAEKEEG